MCALSMPLFVHVYLQAITAFTFASQTAGLRQTAGKTHL
jgi:hypothetical protein